MQEAHPSRTAQRVALRRAAHQLKDAPPLIFEDPLAIRILGPAAAAELQRTPSLQRKPFSGSLRAFVVARARLAEDALAAAYIRGVRQYLVLGAGLDTFACRNPHLDLRVFEVDHPATQAWKRDLLAAARIPIPPSATLVPVNFEHDDLARQLQAAGLDAGLPVMIAWLGVVPYLTQDAFRRTLHVLGSFAAGTCILLDYAQPRATLAPREQLMLDSLAARVRQAGEPFHLFLTPAQLAADMRAAAFHPVEDLDSTAINHRLFADRTDGLALLGGAGRVALFAKDELGSCRS